MDPVGLFCVPKGRRHAGFAVCLCVHAAVKGARVLICSTLKKDSPPLCIRVMQRQRSAQRRGFACRVGGGGGQLDLSCQPFTHNVSFMNASCADLIPFSAE